MPCELTVLGNGHQAKPYVYVRDLVGALNFAANKCGDLEKSKFDVFNVAPDAATSVRFITNELLEQLGFKDRTRVRYGESVQGWPGDVAQSRMDSSKIRNAGFSLPRSSDEAVCLAIRRILEWLAKREEGQDGLRLPPDAKLKY